MHHEMHMILSFDAHAYSSVGDVILFYRHVSPVVFHRVTNGCTDVAIPQRCN